MEQPDYETFSYRSVGAAQDVCVGCGVPISPYSRGRCRRCGYAALKRALPADFLDVLREYGSLGSAKFYHASLSTVTRWRRELGLNPQERMRRPRLRNLRLRGFVETPMPSKRDMSIAGQAADFLRHTGAIFRCDHRGRLPKKGAQGAFWNRGGYVLSDAEVIGRAERLGWIWAEV